MMKARPWPATMDLPFDSVVTDAVFSPCTSHARCAESCTHRLYRYALRWPTGASGDKRVLGIFANPSTADAQRLDPTLTRFRNFARSWGFGVMMIGNVRAWRATNPSDVPADPEAIGECNDAALATMINIADCVICGWGKLGGKERGAHVLAMIRAHGKQPFALRLNRDGSPAHPLYLPSNLMPTPFESLERCWRQ